jgi:hypothetical protein
VANNSRSNLLGNDAKGRLIANCDCDGDCSKWLEAHDAKQSSVIEAYVKGMVNGMIMGANVSIWGDAGNPRPSKQVYYWLNNYCKNNPQKDLAEGVAAFANEVTQFAYQKSITR